MPTLKLNFKDKSLGDYQLQKGLSLTIGRQKNNDVVIDNLAVSSHHAKIDSVGEGFVLIDLQSKNGSFVNEELINAHWLKQGDVINIGKHSLTFCYTDGEDMPDDGSDDIEKTMVMDTSQYRSMLEKSKPKVARPVAREAAKEAGAQAVAKQAEAKAVAKKAAPKAVAKEAVAREITKEAVVRKASKENVAKANAKQTATRETTKQILAREIKKGTVGILAYLAGGNGKILLSGKITKIGRDRTSDVVVKGMLICRTAATISRRPDGFYLSYVGGAFKPKVNEKTVKKSILLNDLDIIYIGSTKLQFFERKLRKKMV